jgi:opacity protein-like surface antigen
LLVPLFAALGLGAAPAAAQVASPPPPNGDPLAPDYVDYGIHLGPAWRGSLGDGRFSSVGFGFGMTLDIGRAPFWLGAYADASFFPTKGGFVDPVSGEGASLDVISAGWRARVAVRIAPRLVLYPSLGAGFGWVSYSSGTCSPGILGYQPGNCHDADFHGLGIQANATLAYTWRFVALTLEPFRVSAFLFEHRDGPLTPYPPGYDYGVARNSVAFAASAGVSLDLSAMALALWSAVKRAGQAAAAAATSL